MTTEDARKHAAARLRELADRLETGDLERWELKDETDLRRMMRRSGAVVIGPPDGWRTIIVRYYDPALAGETADPA